MKIILLILALLFCGCDSINEAQRRNTAELPSNPEATPNPSPTPDATSYPAAEYEAEKENQ